MPDRSAGRNFGRRERFGRALPFLPAPSRNDFAVFLLAVDQSTA